VTIFRKRQIFVTLAFGFLFVSVMGCVTDQAETRKRAQALQDLGNALAAEGKLRAGLAKLLEAVRIDPDNADLNHQIAILLRNLNEYDLSLKYFNRALQLKPRFPEARNNLGTLYLLMERWDAAIACFQEALGDILYETPQFAYNNMGYAYYMKGDYDQAIASYQQALRSSRSYTVAYVNLGRAYEAKGELELAAVAYNNAVVHAPKYAAAHLGLAKVLLKQEKKKEAKEQLDLTIWANPTGPEAQEARELLNLTGNARN